VHINEISVQSKSTRLGVTGPANLRRNIEQRVEAADVFASKLAPTIAGLQSVRRSQRQIAADLNQLGVRTAKGGEWSLIQIQRVIKRLLESSKALPFPSQRETSGVTLACRIENGPRRSDASAE